MDPNLTYYELAVDSFDASAAGGQLWRNTSSPSNEIIFSWPKFYWTESKPSIVGIKIISAEIPFVWDAISLGNNTLIYTIGGVPNTITVPVGTYSGTDLASTLQTLISAITAGMTVSWNSSTLSFTFTQTISAVAWSLYFPSKATLYSVVGFLAGSTVSTVGVGSSITSTVVANLNGPYYLYVNSRAMGQFINFNLTAGNTASVGTPSLCRIPINVNRGGIVFYNDPNPTMFFDYYMPNGLEVFDVYLSLGADQEQTPLDMKGVPWSVKFGIWAYREASHSMKRPSDMIS